MRGTLTVKKVYGNTNFQNVKINILPVKQYILVSGLFYPDDHNSYKLSGSFDSYVQGYIKKIVQSQKGNDFIIYDVNILAGTIIKTEYSPSSSPKKSILNFDIVINSDYKLFNNSYRLDNTSKKIISKNDIYKLIEEIGMNDPNTLQEVHVFSHAYWNGPILVNTDSGRGDCDMRKADITSGTINSANFKNAFTTNGYIKIWGCSFPVATNALFSKFRNNKQYSTTKIISDTVVFNFSPNTFFFYPKGESAVDLLPQINNILGTTYKASDSIKLTFLEIKKILIYNYLSVYAGVIAKNIGVKVISALPATYANIDPTFHIAPSTMANVTFYKKHLEVEINENYGVFDEATVQRLETIYNS
ncbi:hypothetical protein OMO38_07325 [Chryseobacterium sp. 09-1422]|uniref:Uncharacterized protein n=1 Tax=Chryseobacterium kimseyorum TaxID=2984028 RepID=A0ABT3HX03_9FLAO|nr:hypothetical protein [Chryseobacterium kimseyorum]MCW3168334.1 hypothetical protein [Chryseobacterium kimseyorum]